VGSLNRRAGALEEYIESQVQERFEEEVEALVDLLEKELTREEFVKVARIVREARSERELRKAYRAPGGAHRAIRGK
jgi:hypothetical protein